MFYIYINFLSKSIIQKKKKKKKKVKTKYNFIFKVDIFTDLSFFIDE